MNPQDQVGYFTDQMFPPGNSGLPETVKSRTVALTQTYDPPTLHSTLDAGLMTGNMARWCANVRGATVTAVVAVAGIVSVVIILLIARIVVGWLT